MTGYTSLTDQLYARDFDEFKMRVSECIDVYGENAFFDALIEEDTITEFYAQNRNKECLYLLAALDYFCRVRQRAKVIKYADFSRMRLKQTLWPENLRLLNATLKYWNLMQKIKSNAVPEFLKYNIVEGDILNVG